MTVFKSFKSLLILGVMVCILVAILFWLYLNVQASMHVSSKNVQVRLSHSLPTKIHVGNYLETMSKGKLDTQINVNHQLKLPLKGKYLADLQFTVEVPVEVSVDYQTMIKIDQTMPLNATTDLVYQNKLLPKFPLSMDIPIKLDVPFHLKRTYQIPIKIMFNGPVYMAFDEPVNLHVKHQFRPELNINDPMTMRKIANFNATLINEERNTRSNLEMNIQLPVKNIHP